MGNGARPKVIDIIPDDIKASFEVADIVKVFEVLEKYFNVSKNWRKEFQTALKNASRAEDEREVFAKFLRDWLDPSLKHITKREDSVIFSVMRFVCKDRIEERKKYDRTQFNYYNTKRR
jgi:hypothetical protein